MRETEREKTTYCERERNKEQSTERKRKTTY